MLIQKHQPVISAGIERGWESLRGAIYSNLWASPTWKWASKELRITGKSCEGAHMGLSPRHRFSTSKIIDHPLPKYGRLTRFYSAWTWVLNSRCPFYCSHSTDRPCGHKPCFEYACWQAPLWPVVVFKWLLLSSAQDGKAQHFRLAEPSAARAKLHSPQHRYTKGVSIVYLQFTVEIPKFFIAMNNWAVWSGHSTKSCSIHSKALGGGSLSSMNRGGGHTPAWRRSWSSPPFLCSCLSLFGLHLLRFDCTVQHSCHHSWRSDLPPPPGTHHK